jgi:hypothetical protein
METKSEANAAAAATATEGLQCVNSRLSISAGAALSSLGAISPIEENTLTIEAPVQKPFSLLAIRESRRVIIPPPTSDEIAKALGSAESFKEEDEGDEEARQKKLTLERQLEVLRGKVNRRNAMIEVSKRLSVFLFEPSY